MRRLAPLIFALLFLVVAAAPSHAVELRNHDKRAYNVVVKSKRATKRIRMPAHSASLVVCVGTCVFRVPGVGRMRASGNDVVTIQKKKLTKKVVARPPALLP